MAWPTDEVRQTVGDVLLVGGTFYHSGCRVVLDNGVSFPVYIELVISSKGIRFSKVKLEDGKDRGKA